MEQEIKWDECLVWFLSDEFLTFLIFFPICRLFIFPFLLYFIEDYSVFVFLMSRLLEEPV